MGWPIRSSKTATTLHQQGFCSAERALVSDLTSAGQKITAAGPLPRPAVAPYRGSRRGLRRCRGRPVVPATTNRPRSINHGSQPASSASSRRRPRRRAARASEPSRPSAITEAFARQALDHPLVARAERAFLLLVVQQPAGVRLARRTVLARPGWRGGERQGEG